MLKILDPKTAQETILRRPPFGGETVPAFLALRKQLLDLIKEEVAPHL